MIELHDFGGEGPDLLLVHGGGDNLETWRDFAPLLARDFHTRAYDARGHGRCQAPDVASVEAMVEDLLDVAARLDRPVVVGHSMGGVNALLAAGRTRGLGWTGSPRQLEADAATLASESPHRDLIRAVFRRNHVPNGDGRLRRRPELGLAVELAEIYRGRASGLTGEKIEAARCPVLLLCSESWVTADDARRTLDALSVRVEWLYTTHYVHWDEPELVADRIRRFACGS